MMSITSSASRHPGKLPSDRYIPRTRSGRAGVLGFTLFEVAISLVILAFGVISIMTLFPAGLKAQQLSRFQLYAAVKAEEMIEQFNAAHPDNATLDSEGSDLWEAPVAHRSQAWDIDARLASHRYGIMPLPLELARRIDSDGDEIQNHLAAGGQLYYSQARAATSTEEQGMAESPPNDAQKLVFIVSGHAQQNAIHIFPLKNWPYLVNYPSPPMHGLHMWDSWIPPLSTSAGTNFYNLYKYPEDHEDFCYPWETTRINGLAIPGTDPDIQKIFHWREGTLEYGYFPYACGRRGNNYDGGATDLGGGVSGQLPSRDAAIRYVQSALWYCQKKGLPSSFWTTPISANIPDFEPMTADADKWKQVQAMRFLSHAATCLTAWFPRGPGAVGVDNLTAGVRIPTVMLDGVPGAPELVITHNHIVYYHERCLRLAMTFAASFPYDWAVPRPVERTIMTDFPLLQYDLFSPPRQGTIFGTSPAIVAKQWRPLSPRPIKNIGLSYTYPLNQEPGGKHKLEATTLNGAVGPLFGNLDHYTLTAPFEASERCRELIFWAVDWQSYEDFETLPSAPVDASKYPIAGPRNRGAGAVQTLTPNPFNRRMWDLAFVDPHLFAYRNPEKNELFQPVGGTEPRELPTGSDVEGYMVMNGLWVSSALPPGTPRPPYDQGDSLQARKTFNGQHGADRNFNKKIDRGIIPPSVRLRAVQVARFNVYDPRIPCLVR